MVLHIGFDKLIQADEIIGIFDFETSTTGKITNEFLRKAEQAGQIINAAVDIPKSYIVCGEKEKKAVYISTLSAQTLYKRASDNNLI